MKNVSTAFKNELYKGNRNYIKSARIILSDSTIINLDNSDFWSNGIKVENAVSSNGSFDIGAVIIGQLTLTLNNIEEKFSDYDFTNAKIDNVKVGLKLPDNTIESLTYGVYTVNETSYNGSIITITAYDNMYKFDKTYSKSNLTYPATLNEIVRDACSVCDVTLQTVNFDNDDFVVNEKPADEAITFRNVLQWVAQIACKYCTIDEYGRLVLSWYDMNVLENIQHLDGGRFSPWTNENTVSGGTFSPWTAGNIYDGGTFEELRGYHHLYSWNTLSLTTDDVVITGVRVTEEIEGEDGKENVSYQSGTDGYVLAIEGNKLIQGTASTVAGYLGVKINGMRFRPFSGSTLSNPTIEPGDAAILTDRKGNIYNTIITTNTFQPGNFQTISCEAKSPARNSASRYSQATQAYVDARKEIQKEKTDREQAIEELTNRINNSSGTFTTIETQPDGSNIYYLHNKPQLADSDIIWKMTAEAWGVSTDGGKTYNAGMTVDGDTIVRILSAVGINADWINAGDMSADRIRGGTLILGGGSNGNGILRIYNASGTQIGYIDNTGVHFNQGTFSGSLQAASGTFAGNLSAAGGTFKGSLQAASGTFAGNLSAAGGTFNGNLQAATGSFSGSITSNNAIITGGKIQMAASSSETNFIILGFEYSGGSSSLSLSGSSMTLTEGNNVNVVSTRMNRIYNGEESTRISAGNIYASNDPTGLTPSNYDYCRLHKGGFYAKPSSGRASYLDDGNLQTAGNIYAWGNIGCSGEKSRIVDTENYSNRKLYSYEFSSPMFGDIGEGITDQNGECYVSFDDVFLESVNSNCEYQVFLQKEGQGDLWVEEKAPQYFLVKGTENLKFAWEVKVKQRDYEYERLEVYGLEPELEKINYETEGLKAVDLLTQEYIENSTFDVTKYYEELEGMLV